MAKSCTLIDIKLQAMRFTPGRKRALRNRPETCLATGLVLAITLK
jgi:hypothetical protein